MAVHLPDNDTIDEEKLPDSVDATTDDALDYASVAPGRSPTISKHAYEGANHLDKHQSTYLNHTLSRRPSKQILQN